MNIITLRCVVEWNVENSLTLKIIGKVSLHQWGGLLILRRIKGMSALRRVIIQFGLNRIEITSLVHEII